MKTFKQYCAESVTEGSTFNNKRIKEFEAEPFRFKSRFKPDSKGFAMERKANFVVHYDRDVYALHIVSDLSDSRLSNKVTMDIPIVSEVDIRGLGVNDIKANVCGTIKNISQTFHLKLFLEFRIQFRTNYLENLLDNDEIKACFEIYNIYEDAPGTEIDKTLAVAQFCNMNRGDFLRLKHKYGLIKSTDELSDQDALDLF